MTGSGSWPCGRRCRPYARALTHRALKTVCAKNQRLSRRLSDAWRGRMIPSVYPAPERGASSPARTVIGFRRSRKRGEADPASRDSRGLSSRVKPSAAGRWPRCSPQPRRARRDGASRLRAGSERARREIAAIGRIAEDKIGGSELVGGTESASHRAEQRVNATEPDASTSREFRPRLGPHRRKVRMPRARDSASRPSAPAPAKRRSPAQTPRRHRHGHGARNVEDRLHASDRMSADRTGLFPAPLPGRPSCGADDRAPAKTPAHDAHDGSAPRRLVRSPARTASGRARRPPLRLATGFAERFSGGFATSSAEGPVAGFAERLAPRAGGTSAGRPVLG